MNYLKENPIGIDFVVQKAQKKIYEYLTDLGYDLDGYGRGYVEKDRVDGKDVFIPKYYKSTSESGLLLFSEGNKFFFITDGLMSSNGIGFYKTKMSIYFCFDLSKVKPNLKQRSDNEILVECEHIYRKCGLGEFDIETGFNRVFRDFKVTGTKYDTEDTGRYHWFKFTSPNTNFKIDKTCNNG